MGDASGETGQTMVNLRAALVAGGADLPDITKITFYVATARAADLIAAARVVHRHLGDHEPPGTLLGVAVLGYRDQLVEVEAIAALP